MEELRVENVFTAYDRADVLQEYRFLLYAAMVVLILIFRPVGLLPRRPRRLMDAA